MALTRYTPRTSVSPWRELDELTRGLSRVFDDAPTPRHKGWMPAVNVEEKNDEIVITAELPGIGEDDVEIELENNILTLRGEKREAREDGSEDNRIHLWERRYGAFQRSFTVPRTVDPEGIDAHFDNGLLTIHLPKAPEAKGRKIAIGRKA